MLTTIVLVLVLLAVVALVAWWMLDFDMPEVVILVAGPVSAPVSFIGTAQPWPGR